MISCLGREANAVKRVKCLQIVLLFYYVKTLGKTKSLCFSMVQFFSNLLLANAEVSLGNLNIPGGVFGLGFVGFSVCEIPDWSNTALRDREASAQE